MTGIRNPAPERADRILDLLDQPGQTSSDASYGRGVAGRCWRCNRHPEGDGASGLCDGCRAFMLGDTTDDPAAATADRLLDAPDRPWLGPAARHDPTVQYRAGLQYIEERWRPEQIEAMQRIVVQESGWPHPADDSWVAATARRLSVETIWSARDWRPFLDWIEDRPNRDDLVAGVTGIQIEPAALVRVVTALQPTTAIADALTTLTAQEHTP